MNFITITKIFSNGDMKITCRSLSKNESVTDIVNRLDCMISTGILASYDIEIVSSK